MQRYNIIFKFPQLAHFYFLSWRIFTSSVGAFLLPQLAKQHRIRLQNFRK